MKYIWEEQDIAPGVTYRLRQSESSILRIVQLEVPVTHRSWAIIDGNQVSRPYTAIELAETLTRDGAMPYFVPAPCGFY